MEAPPRPLLLGSWAATSSEALGSVCGCGGVGGGRTHCRTAARAAAAANPGPGLPRSKQVKSDRSNDSNRRALAGQALGIAGRGAAPLLARGGPTTRAAL